MPGSELRAIPFRAPREARVFKDLILAKLTYAVGKDPANAQTRDWFMAAAHAIRDHVVDRWIATTRRVYAQNQKRVYYLSVEFLIGRVLFDTLSNLEMAADMRKALRELGVDLNQIRTAEPDAALGNGGLGRLAACFMDSLATLGIAAYGYGIRYDHGLFRQTVSEGWQHELPEDWLAFGNPWEFERHEVTYPIGFGGVVEYIGGDAETARAIWYPGETVNAVAYDTPVVGWHGRHVNTLRLWSARATRSCACARSSSSPRRRCRTSCGATWPSTRAWRPCRSTPRSSSTIPTRRSRSPN
jgi:starch phosphorylase